MRRPALRQYEQYRPPTGDDGENSEAVCFLSQGAGATGPLVLYLSRTRVRTLIWRVFLLIAFSLLCAYQPAQLLAQNPPPATSNKGQAVLHITATVVPVTLAPPSSQESSTSRNLAIYLPRQRDMEVTSESHSLQDKSGAVLETTTIVPR